MNADLGSITATGQFSLDNYGGSVNKGMGPLVKVEEASLTATIVKKRGSVVALGLVVGA